MTQRTNVDDIVNIMSDLKLVKLMLLLSMLSLSHVHEWILDILTRLILTRAVPYIYPDPLERTKSTSDTPVSAVGMQTSCRTVGINLQWAGVAET